MDEILDTDITVSLFRERKPIKLLGQLGEKYQVRQEGKGIYRIYGMLFPMQVVVTRELEGHVWLKSLTRDMDISRAENLLDSFDGLEEEETRTKAGIVVNLVSDINSAIFEQIVSGGNHMSEALKKLILPELGELKELLADKEAEIADKDAILTNKTSELADKDAEIATLRHMLAEAGIQS